MKRMLSLLLCGVMLLALLAACGSTTTTPAEDTAPAEDSTPAEDTTPAEDNTAAEIPDLPEETASVTYPLVTDRSVEVEYWYPMNDKVLQKFNTTDDLQLWREMESRTGVKVHLTPVASSNAATDFTLMLTAENYPDLWMSFSNFYTNGWDHAVEEEIVAPLNDYLSVMPNLSALLASDDTMRRQCYTDGGRFPAIPSIKVVGDGHAAQGAWFGYVIRQDWLNELNLSVPETYSEMETVLAAMQANYDKAQNPMYFALGMNSSLFSDPTFYGGYNVTADWFQVDGEVKYGPVEENYRAYVEMMNRWYEAGYISPDFLSNMLPWLDLAESTEESCGVYGMIYTWFDSYKNASPSESFELSALRPLKVNADDTVHIGTANAMATPTAAIWAGSENIELICKWWDYLFGEEGIELGNWGIEGETFELKEDGSKTWIGPFLNPENAPDFDLSTVQFEYLVYNMAGYTQADREYCLVDQKAIDFLDAWNDCETDYNYPASATMTAEENEAYGSRYNDLNTYVSEQVMKFVVGENSFDQWDNFVETAMSMGVEELRGYKQAALDRYNAR